MNELETKTAAAQAALDAVFAVANVPPQKTEEALLGLRLQIDELIYVVRESIDIEDELGVE